jgi:hypothetical protein
LLVPLPDNSGSGKTKYPACVVAGSYALRARTDAV